MNKINIIEIKDVINNKYYKQHFGFLNNYTPLLGDEEMYSNIKNGCILNYEPILRYFIEKYWVLYKYGNIEKLNKFLIIEHVPAISEALLYLKKKYDQYSDEDIYDTIIIPAYKETIIGDYRKKMCNKIKQRYELLNYIFQTDITNIDLNKKYSLIVVNKFFTENMISIGSKIFIDQIELLRKAIMYLEKDGTFMFEIIFIASYIEFKKFISYLNNYFDKIKIVLNDISNKLTHIICKNYNGKSLSDYDNNKQIVDPKIAKKCDKIGNTLINLLEKSNIELDIFEKYKTEEDIYRKIVKERYYRQLNKSIAKAYELDLEVKSKYLKTMVDYDNKVLNKMDSFPEFYKHKILMNIKPEKIIISNKGSLKHPVLEKLSKRLGIFMYDIESRDLKKWSYTTDQIDIFKSLHTYLDEEYNAGSNRHRTSNAFCKMYELLEEFDLLDFDKDTIKTFHICEAPGNFVYATNHYLKTKTKIKTFDWFANSLNAKHPKVKQEYPSAFGDVYGLIEKYPNRWLFGEDNTGDITKMENVNKFIKQLGEVDFLTGDCGISIDQKMSNAQQNILGKVNFAQIVILLSVLRNGGNFAIKHFMPMSNPFIVSYVYLLSRCFNELYICKPICSRPSSREIYLVGKNYNKLNNETLEKIYERFIDFNDKIDLISDIPRKFLGQYYDAIDDLAEKQMVSLNRSFYFYDNPDFFEKYKYELRNSRKTKNKNWTKVYKFVSIENKDKL